MYKKRKALMFCVVFFSFFLGACNDNPVSESALTKADKPIYIEMDPEKFRRSYNVAMVEIDMNYQLSRLFKHNKGDEENVMRSFMSPGINFKLVLASDEKLKQVIVFATGSADKNDSFKPLKIFLGVAQAINPNPILKEQGYLIKLMCDKAIDEMDTFGEVRQDVGNFVYTIRASRVDGLSFIIEPRQSGSGK